MSSPGNPLQPAMPDDQGPQQQQPLLVPAPGNPDLLKLQQVLAQQIGQNGQQTGPAYSPWEVLNRAISPLIGTLMQQRVAKQQFKMQQDAMPEIAAALQSGDPLKAMMASKSPLVQQMALQYMPDWMKSSIALQGKVHERQLLDPMDVKKELDIATGKEPIAVKQATDITAAQIPLEIKKAVGIAQGTLPIDLAKTRAGQAGTFADLAEKKREFELTQAGGSGTTPGPLGQNPASLYGKTQ